MTDADVATKIMGWHQHKLFGEEWWCVIIPGDFAMSTGLPKGVRKLAEYHPTTNIHEALNLLTADVAKRLNDEIMQDPMAICEAALSVKIMSYESQST